MGQPKWKYAKPKKNFNFDEYLILPLDKKFKITIKNWNFTEGNVEGEIKDIFRTDVIKLEGKDVNKILVVKNYENIHQFKKALAKKKSIKSTADLEMTRKYSDDEMEYYFNIVFL